VIDMSTTEPQGEKDPSKGRYRTAAGRVEIRVRGHLEARWSERLEGLTLTRQHDGTTLIAGPVVDQAALFGVINRLRDMALPLLSVTHLEPGPPTDQADNHSSRGTGPTPTSTRPRSQR
jgi:hypothetical protein